MLTISTLHQKINIDGIQKPAIIIDSTVVMDRFHQFRSLIDGVNIFYSVKSNPYIKILELLRDLGSGFEIASSHELNVLKSLGIPADKIITGNTLKTPQFIEEAYHYGVN